MCDAVSKRSPATFVTCIVLGLFVFVVTVMFYNDMLFRVKKAKIQKKESKKDVTSIKRTALATLTLYSFGILIYAIYLNLALCEDSILSSFIFSLGCLAQTIGTLGVFTLFCLRLNFTFANTMFSISGCIKYYLAIVILLMFISHWISLLIVVLMSHGNGNRDLATSIATALAASTVMFLVLNAFIILGLFVKKLGNVIQHCVNNFGVLTQAQLDTLNFSRSVSVEPPNPPITADFGTIDIDNNNNNNNNNNSGLSSLSMVSNENMQSLKSLVRLISDMSKYTILVGVAAISTFLFGLGLSVSRAVVKDYQNAVGIFFLIDSFVNTICLVLQFEFYKKKYHFICSYPHRLCEDRYTKKTNVKNNYQLTRLHSGEIGVIKQDVHLDSGTLPNVNPELPSGQASLSISAANPNDADFGQNRTNDVTTMASNEAALVAQKSLELASY